MAANEAKYAAELDNALKQYVELQEQTAEFDPVELYEARQEIRPNHERNATRRIQNAYSDKYDMLRMYDSKRSVANLLNAKIATPAPSARIFSTTLPEF